MLASPSVIMRRIPTTLLAVLALSMQISCSESTKTTETAAKPPDEAGAISALKSINQAQADFIHRTRRYAQTTDELITGRFLSAKPDVEGYNLVMLPSPDAVHYTAKATPRTADGRHFFTDESGVIRAASGKPATMDSPGI